MRHPSLEVVIDNGGGITVQCARFVHAYDNPAQAAADVAQLLAGTDTSDWEGHNPIDRIQYSGEDIRNGGYRVWDAEALRAATIKDADNDGWHNARAFLFALIAAR